ncbi:MAG: TolB family protein [Thermoanaerobaculia bacterium]
MRPTVAAGGEIFTEVVCTPGDQLRIELSRFTDRNGDGVIQPGEEERLPVVMVRDNEQGKGVTDLNPVHGKVLAKVGLLSDLSSATTLVVRVSDPTSVRAAALQLHAPSRAPETWWRKFARLLDIERNLRAPSKDETEICLLDTETGVTSPMRPASPGILAHPALLQRKGKLAYVEREGRESRIVALELPEARKIATLPGDWPVWIAESSGLAFIRNGEVFGFDLEGLKEKRLGFSADRLIMSRSFGPGSSSLIAVRHAAGLDEPYRLILDPASLAVRSADRLHLDGEAWEPRVSPDGDSFVRTTRSGELWIAKRQGGQETKAAERFRAFDPSWSEEGRYLVLICEPR